MAEVTAVRYGRTGATLKEAKAAAAR